MNKDTSNQERSYEPGDKVTYTPTNEKGVVKSVVDSDNAAFVVFNCANDWDNFQNYTGARVKVTDLKPGWTPSGV